MLSPKAQLNLANARNYFREHLCIGDYYAEGQKGFGQWHGVGAERLGLKGRVGEAEFLALCEGWHPSKSQRLTQRLNERRRSADGRQIANRRVFYDFVFSPPKSVSAVALIKDARIITAHEKAVLHALTELEKFAATRVRKNGQRGERTTGNFVVAAFQHETSRELDPHLHTHAVVLNATYDGTERCWKALEVSPMYQAQKYVENVYYHALCSELSRFGYGIVPARTGFEIEGVSHSLIDIFSKRHRQIDEHMAKVSRPASRASEKTLRERIARDHRRRKIETPGRDELRLTWLNELDPHERKSLETPGPTRRSPFPTLTADAAMAWAEEHLFERRSVVHDFELLSAALVRTRGQAFQLPALHQALANRPYVRQPGSSKLTLGLTLRHELEIVMAARSGRSRFAPFHSSYQAPAEYSPEQAVALTSIFGSRDFITLFRGAAGTGKSFTLREVDRGLRAIGRSVIVAAPQKQQVLALEQDGLVAQTVASLLTSGKLPPRPVVLVDEAGQIGGRELHALLKLVSANQGRLILSGDPRQHGAVTASDALRAIEKFGQLPFAEIQTIRRQDPGLGKSLDEQAAIRAYREAVQAAASGRISASFTQLEELGHVRELPDLLRHQALAEEYLAATHRKENVLVVAQTWREVEVVNQMVRTTLQRAGLVQAGTEVLSYRSVDLTAAEKRDPRFYVDHGFAFFHRRYGRFAKGDLVAIAGVNDRGVVLLKAGRRSTFGYPHTSRISVVSETKLALGRGDRLQLKFNGDSVEGNPLLNGELVTVRRVRRDGTIIVKDDQGRRKTLAAHQRLFHRGYAVTSYGSQGKTVDTVLLSDAGNPAATNRQQWYVSISRGRKRALIFTSDRTALRMAIRHSGDRELALELSTPLPPSVIPRVPAAIWRDRLLRVTDTLRRFRQLPRVTSRSSLRPTP